MVFTSLSFGFSLTFKRYIIIVEIATKIELIKQTLETNVKLLNNI